MPEETDPQLEDSPQTPEGGSQDGTPADEPEGSQAQTSEIDWQKRYVDTQSAYTQTAQEAAQYRQLFEAARQGDPQALQYLGLTIEDDDDFDEEPDEQARLNALENWAVEQYRRQQEQEQQSQYQQMEDQHLVTQLAELEKKHGEIDDDTLKDLYLLGQSLRSEDGFPDLVKAYEYDQQRWEARRQKWVDSKRAPQAPSGASAAQSPDLDDAEQRRKWMQQRLAQAQ